MDWVRKKLYADAVHQAGITGKGVTAAVLDSGISRHPDYAKRIIVFKDFINGRQECYDDASHGTHVSGILCGDGSSSGGRYCGIAPGCSLIHLKVLDRNGEGSMEELIRAIHWVIVNKEKYRIRIMNISAGTTLGEQAKSGTLLVNAVEEAWDAEIVVVVAAGNLGPGPSTVTVPGNSRKVITVGAADWMRRSGGAGRLYSGCGPTQECICKPELVIPGTEVVSCCPYWRNGRYYSKKSGTSMAAPAVAGAAALLLEKEPYLTNVEVKMRMKESAVSCGFPQNRQGWGILDLRRLTGTR
ncbi:S8 family peptidase [Parablautia sp. Marseille-Q6255]|uniref:S8 family peptidase n=1 Tax=Parablautia sp. Marseille-Q6255 TaxID=3039593 RepID=UPI0024BC4DE9|nr:S8 family peptidase [Parablautia sp. Marseille-Q6255]